MKFFFILISLLLFVFVSDAQIYNIRQFTVREGLLHSFVTDIIQDNRGYIWISTGGGLCRFDGIEFRNYTTKQGLCSQRLLCLQEDDNHNIWIGSAHGINVFTGDSIYALKDENFGEYIYSITRSSDGNIWAATDMGISKLKFEKGQISYMKFPFDLVDIENSVIFQDRSLSVFLFETSSGDLIAGLSNNVYLIRKNKIYRIKHDPRIKINTACETKDGIMVMGTNMGIYKLVKNTVVPIYNKFIDGVEVIKIKPGKSKLWLLGKYQNENNIYLMSVCLNDSSYFRKIGKHNGLINYPTSIFIDHENNIWTGSNGGLSVLKGETFVVYNSESGLTGDKIWGVAEDMDKRIWVGSIGQGLSIITKDSIYKFTTDNGLPDMYIGKIYQDQKNHFLLGTAKHGLCTADYNEEKDKFVFKQLYIGMNTGDTRVDDIIRDKDQILWVASSKGLYFSEDNISFRYQPLIGQDYGKVFVQKLFMAKDQTVYIGTKNQGLFRKTEGGIIHLMDSINVSSICEDTYGNIWIGSQNKGIKNISKENSEWISESKGLTSDIVYILQNDGHNNLWIGSNLGLDRFDAGEYSKTGKIIIRHYDIDDGLLDLEMNLNGSIIDHNGNLWFASNNGLLRYDYKYDVSNRVPPITNILSLKLHSKKTDWLTYSDTLQTWTKLPLNPVIPYSQNHLTFDFVGISYKNPSEILYTWKLEGFDNEWMIPTKNRQAVYSNLPPGSYTFMLKSANNDGVWNENTVNFNFEIIPPYWLTWWFKILAVLTLIIVAYLLLKWRTRALQNRQKELTKLVAIRTQEITAQKEIVEEKNREILDSINYANHLQKAILPPPGIIQQYFPDSFIYFKPKDVVSGDFYWFEQFDDKYYFAVADCTGHGVPGALVSVVCENALNNAMKEFEEREPAKILDKTRELVIETFEKSREKVNDGMDIALCSYDPKTRLLNYAGANNPLFIIRDKEIIILKPNKQPIGKQIISEPFNNHQIKLEKGDVLYLFTDGYADQFGGEKGRKFLLKNFRDLLLEIHSVPIYEQVESINEIFVSWKGSFEQVDDICIMGVKI